MELFKPEPGLIVWTTITFLALVTLLWKFGLRPINDLLAKRAKKIEDSLKEAEDTRGEAERLFENYKEQLREAREETQNIIEQGKVQGEKTRKDIVDKAKEEAERLIAKAEKEINHQKEKALADLRTHVADLTIEAASRVVEKSLSKEDHSKLIDDYLQEVDKLYEQN